MTSIEFKAPDHGDQGTCAFCGGTIRYTAKGAANANGGFDLVTADWVHVYVDDDGQEVELMADHQAQQVIEWVGPVPKQEES